MSDRFEVEPTPKKKRRWALWLAIVILVPIVGVFAYVLTVHNDLNNLIADLDRTDPGWRLEEIEAKRATYPADQNAALEIPKINALLKPNYNQLNKEMDLLSGLDPPALLNQQQVDALHRLKAESSDATVEARKLVDLPHGRHPVTWSPDWISTILHCQDNRLAVNLLKHDALDWAQRGDGDAALRSTLAGFNCGASVGDEPMTISQLVRVACQAIALNILERVLAQTEPSDAALESFQKRLEEVEKEPLLLYCFRGERAGEYHLLEWLRQGNSAPGISGGSASGFDFVAFYLHVPGVIASQTVGCMRYMTEMIDVAKKPPEQWTAEFATLRQQVPNLPVLARLLVPAMDKIAQAVQRSYAQQRCAIVVLAAERFRRKNNRWPESPDELLKAGLLKAIPTDPYTGGPLKWKRTADGALIYSVGRNLIDDGGVFDRTSNKLESDYGFELWDVAKRRQPAPPPKKVDENP
jgi:hypothetical protein